VKLSTGMPVGDAVIAGRLTYERRELRTPDGKSLIPETPDGKATLICESNELSAGTPVTGRSGGILLIPDNPEPEGSAALV
jgi:hypothetical protein